MHTIDLSNKKICREALDWKTKQLADSLMSCLGKDEIPLIRRRLDRVRKLIPKRKAPNPKPVLGQ